MPRTCRSHRKAAINLYATVAFIRRRILNLCSNSGLETYLDKAQHLVQEHTMYEAHGGQRSESHFWIHGEEGSDLEVTMNLPSLNRI